MTAALSLIATYGPLLVLYGGAALLAVWSTRKDWDLGLISVMLLACFILSNVTWFLGDVEVRPGIYTFLQVMVASSAYIAWCYSHDPDVDQTWRRRGLVLLVCLAVAYIIINVAFAWSYRGEWSQLHFHEVSTNLIFLAECLTTSALGALNVVRVGRFFDWIMGRRPNAQSHANVEGDQG